MRDRKKQLEKELDKVSASIPKQQDKIEKEKELLTKLINKRISIMTELNK